MKRDNKYFHLIDLIVLALFVVQIVSANDLNNADDATQNKSATSEDVFDFPEDHVLHQPEEIVKNSRLFSEWLYWTGILHDTDTGDLYGFQYTLFQMDLTPGSMAFINHAAISDVRNSQHPLYGYSIFPDQAISRMERIAAKDLIGGMKITRRRSPIGWTLMPGTSTPREMHPSMEEMSRKYPWT
jgi:hypothetical protein